MEEKGLPGRTYIGAEEAGGGRSLAEITAAMERSRRHLGERVREGRGNGQERRRRDERALMRTSAYGREARIAAFDELNATKRRRRARLREEDGAGKKTGASRWICIQWWGKAGWRGELDAVRFTSDGGEREAVGFRV